MLPRVLRGYKGGNIIDKNGQLYFCYITESESWSGKISASTSIFCSWFPTTFSTIEKVGGHISGRDTFPKIYVKYVPGLQIHLCHSINEYFPEEHLAYKPGLCTKMWVHLPQLFPSYIPLPFMFALLTSGQQSPISLNLSLTSLNVNISFPNFFSAIYAFWAAPAITTRHIWVFTLVSTVNFIQY